jgi:hypothetical protein
MLRKRNQSKQLWKSTSANRRKRKVHLNKQKAFNRKRAALMFFEENNALESINNITL